MSDYIAMFGKCLKTKPGTEVERKTMITTAFIRGFIFTPDCYSAHNLNWLQKKKFINSEISDLVDIDSIPLDRIEEYARKFGTPEAINPDEIVLSVDSRDFLFSEFTVIQPIPHEELYPKIRAVIESDKELDFDALDNFSNFFKNYGYADEIDIEKIENKRTQAGLAVFLNKLPSDPFDLMRAIMFKFVSSIDLTKNKETIEKIKIICEEEYTEHIFDFSELSDEQLRTLSKVFYRYKPIFLAAKNFKKNVKSINRISRLAKKSEKIRAEENFWDTVLALKSQNSETVARAKKEVGSLDNLTKVKIMQNIMERIILNNTKRLYISKSGNVFERSDCKMDNPDHLVLIYQILRESLIDSLKEKAKPILLPKGIELACPSSKTKFVGDIPFGSFVELPQENGSFGACWDNNQIKKALLGYFKINDTNNSMQLQVLGFSDDITCAYFDGSIPNGVLRMNVFSSSFKTRETDVDIYFAKNQNIRNGKKPDKKDIIFETSIGINRRYHIDKGIGIFVGNKFVFSGSCLINDIFFKSKRFVPGIWNKLSTSVDTGVNLRQILSEAGFEILTERQEAGQFLDLSKPSKDVLVELFR